MSKDKAARPWYRKKRWWAVGSFAGLIGLSAIFGRGTPGVVKTGAASPVTTTSTAPPATTATTATTAAPTTTAATQAPSTTASATATPAATQPATPTTSASPGPDNPPSSPTIAATTACADFFQVVPDIAEAVGAQNLTFAIRLQLGYPDPTNLNSRASANFNGPYPSMLYDASDAADPTYGSPVWQPFEDLVTTMDNVINNGDPGSPSTYSALQSAADAVNSYCQKRFPSLASTIGNS